MAAFAKSWRRESKAQPPGTIWAHEKGGHPRRPGSMHRQGGPKTDDAPRLKESPGVCAGASRWRKHLEEHV
jgi:hypothetical protein